MKIEALKGTRDFLPSQAALREYMEEAILSCYRENGFRRIMTPAIEDIENLDKSDGGENLNLIFRIMKRGDKLQRAIASGEELCDMGLRYDLTLPLSRYYCANRAKLEAPFKCIQLDRVYRAERPQKGRMREFIQCDIDVIGDSSPSCETELITVTAMALSRLDIGSFTVKINDRRILNALLTKCGFPSEQLPSVCISLDKLDKTGAKGVAQELADKGFSADSIQALSDILERLPLTEAEISELVGDELAAGMLSIIRDTRALSEGKFTIEPDLSLVRGQGYYTGTVFEIRSDKFSSSVAGGGRYDGLIGKFIGENIPACGFSIGFERIFEILSALGREGSSRRRIAYIYSSSFPEAFAKAQKFRGEYDVSLFSRPKKMKSFLDRLAGSGFSGFVTEEATDIRFFSE